MSTNPTVQELSDALRGVADWLDGLSLYLLGPAAETPPAVTTTTKPERPPFRRPPVPRDAGAIADQLARWGGVATVREWQQWRRHLSADAAHAELDVLVRQGLAKWESSKSANGRVLRKLTLNN